MGNVVRYVDYSGLLVIRQFTDQVSSYNYLSLLYLLYFCYMLPFVTMLQKSRNQVKAAAVKLHS